MSKNVNVNTNMNIPLVLVVLTVPIFLWEPPISMDMAQSHVVDALKKRGDSQRRRKVEMGSLLQIAHKMLLALMALAIQSILGSVDLGNLHTCSVDALEKGGGQEGEEELGNC